MTWLKIVPDSEPDADGEWVEVHGVPNTLGRTFLRAENMLRPYIPSGHHIVAVQEQEPVGAKK